MSGDAEIELALAETTARLRALEAQLQTRRDAESRAIERAQREVATSTRQLAEYAAQRAQLVAQLDELERGRCVVLGFSRQGWRVAQQLLRAALAGCVFVGFSMLGLDPDVSTSELLLVTFVGSWLAWFLGDAADHLELQ